MSKPRNWAALRDDYVTSVASLAAIAAASGVPLRSVERHALDRCANAGKTWAELRTEFRAGVTLRTREVASKTAAESWNCLADGSLDVALRSLAKLRRRLQTGSMSDRDLISVVKLALTNKIEIGEGVVASLDMQHSLSDLTLDELQRLAGPSQHGC